MYLRIHLTALLILAALLAAPPCSLAVDESIPCIAEPTDMPIDYGNIVDCSIGTVTDTDVFRFPGSAGERIRLRVVRHGNYSSFEPCLELLSSGSSIAIACDFAASNEIEMVLPTSDTYTIVVDDHSTNGFGPYLLALDRISPFSPTSVPIQHGEVLASSIDPVSDLDFFVFHGTPGDHLRIQVARMGSYSSFEPCIELFASDGTLVDAACEFAASNEMNVAIESGGNYAILVQDHSRNGYGQYNLALECILGACTPLASKFTAELPGSVISGINGVGGWKCPQIGEITIVFDETAPIVAARRLPRPDTAAACSNDGRNGFLAEFNYALLGSGEHTVRYLDGGVEFARKTFSVGTLGPSYTPFATDVSGECELSGFPVSGMATTVRWREELQGFVIIGAEAK